MAEYGSTPCPPLTLAWIIFRTHTHFGQGDAQLQKALLFSAQHLAQSCGNKQEFGFLEE